MNGPLTYRDLAELMKSSAGISVDATQLEADSDREFGDLGLDSLGLLGIVAELENRHGMPLGADAETCKTPRDFVRVVNSQLTSGV